MYTCCDSESRDDCQHYAMTSLQMTVSVLNLAMIVFSALMIWKGVMVFTNSESPVVVVLRWGERPHMRARCVLSQRDTQSL